MCIMSLVSTKKSYEDFEIVDIQFVVSKFGTQRFDFIFAVCIRLFEKFSQSKKSLYSATYWISSIISRVSMVQVNWIYLIFNHVPFLVDSSEVRSILKRKVLKYRPVPPYWRILSMNSLNCRTRTAWKWLKRLLIKSITISWQASERVCPLWQIKIFRFLLYFSPGFLQNQFVW